jgi:hypothetical protein
MKKQFTLTLLCNANGVKFDVKKIEVTLPTSSFVCDFYPKLDFKNLADFR